MNKNIFVDYLKINIWNYHISMIFYEIIIIFRTMNIKIINMQHHYSCFHEMVYMNNMEEFILQFYIKILKIIASYRLFVYWRQISFEINVISTLIASMWYFPHFSRILPPFTSFSFFFLPSFPSSLCLYPSTSLPPSFPHLSFLHFPLKTHISENHYFMLYSQGTDSWIYLWTLTLV